MNQFLIPRNANPGAQLLGLENLATSNLDVQASGESSGALSTAFVTVAMDICPWAGSSDGGDPVAGKASVEISAEEMGNSVVRSAAVELLLFVFLTVLRRLGPSVL